MIKKPVFTEKSFGATAFDTFTFKVAKTATKDQIKRDIETLYGVNVVSVNTSSFKSRVTRSFRKGKNEVEKGFKKAMVKLKPGQKIKLFNTN